MNEFRVELWFKKRYLRIFDFIESGIHLRASEIFTNVESIRSRYESPTENGEYFIAVESLRDSMWADLVKNRITREEYWTLYEFMDNTIKDRKKK